MAAPKHKILFIALVCTPLLAIVVLVVAAMFSGGSAGGTLSSGRAVMTYSDSISLNSKFSSDTATITTAGKTIVVEPSRLIVDGTTVADIDDSVANVEVRVKRGNVTFVADGKQVPTKLR